MTPAGSQREGYKWAVSSADRTAALHGQTANNDGPCPLVMDGPGDGMPSLSLSPMVERSVPSRAQGSRSGALAVRGKNQAGVCRHGGEAVEPS